MSRLSSIIGDAMATGRVDQSAPSDEHCRRQIDGLPLSRNLSTTEVTIGILNYNGMSTLPATIQAVCDLRHPVHEIVVADNASTDGSREWLQRMQPQVRCLCLKDNLGPAGGRSALLAHANTEFVFLLDNDITVNPDTLDRLLEALRAVPTAAISHPEIRDANDPSVHHYNGGWTHCLGIYISRPEPVGIRPAFEIFPAVSGQAMLVRRQVAEAVGGYDTDYFFNKEDGDFTSRITLAGYACVNVPAATVQHRNKPRGTAKAFYQIRNRWYFILKLYHWRTLVLLSPLLLVFELLLAGFMVRKGAFLVYARGNLAAIKHLPMVLKKRHRFQRLKKMRDRDWLRAGEMFIPTSLKPRNPFVRSAQHLFYEVCKAYWQAVRPFC